MMENLFNCLCSSLMLPGNKTAFLKGEGLQLMNLMLRYAELVRVDRSVYIESDACNDDDTYS